MFDAVGRRVSRRNLRASAPSRLVSVYAASTAEAQRCAASAEN